METNKIISSLCYFSVFFAAFLLPIVVYFVAKDPFIKSHAKRAFFSHLLPFITFVVLVLIAVLSAYTFEGWIIIGFIIALIVNFIVFVWNIIQGIKVLIH